MSDWLRLTEEDIAKIEAETRSRPRTPAALTLHDDEIAADAPPTPVRSHTLRLTSADLAPVAPKCDNTHDLTQLETLMFGLTNQARQAELPRWLGDRKLRWDDRVSAVARGHPPTIPRSALTRMLLLISVDGIVNRPLGCGFGATESRALPASVSAWTRTFALRIRPVPHSGHYATRGSPPKPDPVGLFVGRAHQTGCL